MRADELAAVSAAAALLFASDAPEPEVPAPSRWGLAGRLRSLDAADAKRLTAARRRWTMSGRLRD